jgi:Domain of unknown function (DUF4251)
MNKTICFIGAFILLMLNNEVSCYGQSREDPGLSKSQTRKERRELKRKADQLTDSLNFTSAKAAIENKKWSLEVKTLYDKNGMPIQIDNPRDNVSMRGETTSIHLSLKYDAIDKKGIGAISARGTVLDYSKKVDKKGVITIRYLVLDKGKNAEVVITLSGEGNNANAEIESPTTGKKIRFSGKLVPYEKME